jgi:hypothetical protein
MQDALSTAAFSHDHSLDSFSFDNESYEVPLEEASEVPSELLGRNNIDLTENPEEILSSELFEQELFEENGPLYLVTPEMSFSTWTNLDKYVAPGDTMRYYGFTLIKFTFYF